MQRSRFSRKPNNDVKTKSFAIEGGLNLVDSPLTIPDGMFLAGVNYEMLTRKGARRLAGIERYNGMVKPTDSTYWILNYDGGTIAFVEGNTVTGLTTGHTAEVLSVWGTTAAAKTTSGCRCATT